MRAWAPSAAFREAVRSAALATLAFYVGIVETLANEADQGDGGDAEMMHLLTNGLFAGEGEILR